MLIEQIKADLIAAVKNQDEVKVLVLRFLLSEIHNREIDLRVQKKELTDAMILAVIQKEIRRRQEAILAFQRGRRPELVAKELAEQKILAAYLPAALTDQELKALIEKTMTETNSKDFGLIMKMVMSRLKGQADGQKVAQIVKSLLD
jgi:uncharacterized protein YqeY